MATHFSELSESDFTCLFEQKIISKQRQLELLLIYFGNIWKAWNSGKSVCNIESEANKWTFRGQVTDLKSLETCFISFNIWSFLISEHFFFAQLDLYICTFVSFSAKILEFLLIEDKHRLHCFKKEACTFLSSRRFKRCNFLLHFKDVVKNKIAGWMIKQLLNSVFAKYRDSSVSCRSIICPCLRHQQIIDLFNTTRSSYGVLT